jgi:hypothetical protein
MMIIKRLRELKINMGNYESVTLNAYAEMEVSDPLTAAEGFISLDALLDDALKNDVLNAQQATSLDVSGTFIHDWESK